MAMPALRAKPAMVVSAWAEPLRRVLLATNAIQQARATLQQVSAPTPFNRILHLARMKASVRRTMLAKAEYAWASSLTVPYQDPARSNPHAYPLPGYAHPLSQPTKDNLVMTALLGVRACKVIATTDIAAGKTLDAATTPQPNRRLICAKSVPWLSRPTESDIGPT